MYAVICNSTNRMEALAPAGGFRTYTEAEKAGERWRGNLPKGQRRQALVTVVEIVEDGTAWHTDAVDRRFVLSEDSGWAVATFDGGHRLPCYIFAEDIMIPQGTDRNGAQLTPAQLATHVHKLWNRSGNPTGPKRVAGGVLGWVSCNTGEVLVTRSGTGGWFGPAGLLCDADRGHVIVRDATPAEFFLSATSPDGVIEVDGKRVFVR